MSWVKATGLRRSVAVIALAGTIVLGSCASENPVEPLEPIPCATGFLCVREPEPVAGGLFFSTIVAGGEHSCALTTGGVAYCWGSNRNGQLGNGSAVQSSSSPVEVSGGRTYTEISAGALHTCALTAQGAAYCWGNGSNGALGSGLLQELCGTVECSREPLQVIGGHNFQAIDAGFNHTCAVTASSLAYCWGANRHGELGTGTFFGGSSLPEPVAGGHQFSSLSVGTRYSCGLTLEGAALCWGSGETDAIGVVAEEMCPSGPSGADCTALPLAVETEVAFVRVAAGDTHACALSTALSAWCWGDNAAGQLGVEGTARTHVPQPVTVPGGEQVAQLSAADSHTCAVTTAFSAFCWGSNRSAQLGIGSDGDSPVAPARVMGDFDYERITAGGNPITSHTCALSAARRAFCWGSRELGQVGGGG